MSRLACRPQAVVSSLLRQRCLPVGRLGGCRSLHTGNSASPYASSSVSTKRLDQSNFLSSSSPTLSPFSRGQRRCFSRGNNELKAAAAPSQQPVLNAKFQEGNDANYEQQLVNVKKVIVIGSGGLSIGQAGEFDYSGMCHSAAFGLPPCFNYALLANCFVSFEPRRYPSSKGVERSWCQISSHKLKYRNYPNRS